MKGGFLKNFNNIVEINTELYMNITIVEICVLSS